VTRTLLLGGARSGKSAMAVELGRRHGGEVVFVATAEPVDDDLAARIARHRAERPGWPTVDAPVELPAAVAATPADAMVIVDCLTVWLGNLFVHVPDPARRRGMGRDLDEALRTRHGPAVVVSNEVGLGLVPDNVLGRDYRDELGRLNQEIAAIADRTLLLVAGKAVLLADPWSL
jgi:adenosylcobinamide kinase / adenosylcobinamide-phosphate guanylyltransferase